MTPSQRSSLSFNQPIRRLCSPNLPLKIKSKLSWCSTNSLLNFTLSRLTSLWISKPNPLKKLEDFAAQNQLNKLKKRSTSPISSQATMYTRSSDPDIVCPHCKQGFRACSHCFKSGHTKDSCYQKHPEKRAPKSVASSSKQHSCHLTWYTQEDEEYLQQKYPDLHLW
jgi:hypothetical protein